MADKPDDPKDSQENQIMAIRKILLELQKSDSDKSLQGSLVRRILHDTNFRIPSITFMSGLEKGFRINNFYLIDTINDQTGLSINLTPKHLISNIVPYIEAIFEIQRVMNEIREIDITTKLGIISISQNSPISVSLQGVADAVKLIQESIVPWRRRHAVQMAQLTEQEKLLEIKAKEIELVELRARAKKEDEEARKAFFEIIRQQEEIKKLALENEKLRLEIEQARSNFVLELLEKIKPGMTEQEKLTYFVKLLPPVSTITDSMLELSNDLQGKQNSKDI